MPATWIAYINLNGDDWPGVLARVAAAYRKRTGQQPTMLRVHPSRLAAVADAAAALGLTIADRGPIAQPLDLILTHGSATPQAPAGSPDSLR